MRQTMRLAAPLALLLMPGLGQAASIYLNGTRVDGAAGLANLKIEKCNVSFDDKSNVHIDCPGYAIKLDGNGEKPSAADDSGTGKLTKRYFLVTEQAQQGATEFDIDVFINSKWVRKLRSSDEQLVEDITKHLKAGKNVITFAAKKKPAEGARKSFSPEHFYRVIIGEGAANGDKVMIDDTVMTFKRTAAEDKDVSEEFTLNTK